MESGRGSALNNIRSEQACDFPGEGCRELGSLKLGVGAGQEGVVLQDAASWAMAVPLPPRRAAELYVLTEPAL
jgi:hypothetical protein